MGGNSLFICTTQTFANKMFLVLANCDGNAVLRAHLEDRSGKQYMKFDGLDLDIQIEDYGVHLEHLFNGDPVLSTKLFILFSSSIYRSFRHNFKMKNTEQAC